MARARRGGAPGARRAARLGWARAREYRLSTSSSRGSPKRYLERRLGRADRRDDHGRDDRVSCGRRRRLSSSRPRCVTSPAPPTRSSSPAAAASTEEARAPPRRDSRAGSRRSSRGCKPRPGPRAGGVEDPVIDPGFRFQDPAWLWTAALGPLAVAADVSARARAAAPSCSRGPRGSAGRRRARASSLRHAPAVLAALGLMAAAVALARPQHGVLKEEHDDARRRHHRRARRLGLDGGRGLPAAQPAGGRQGGGGGVRASAAPPIGSGLSSSPARASPSRRPPPTPRCSCASSTTCGSTCCPTAPRSAPVSRRR